jgi:hypothetical protein
LEYTVEGESVTLKWSTETVEFTKKKRKKKASDHVKKDTFTLITGSGRDLRFASELRRFSSPSVPHIS